ncbi:unnamed protein product [Paramecium octaurelia]|uniref:Uncharacterized protein n=1 Tax=Paramecium octaurelia TaxID=43137 RepID=A0A8S1RZ96_PAROT|nr:unnamed protein product [Paramecium octaurelia]
MRILIVNGYGKSETGKQQFERYCGQIRKLFLNQKELLDTETEFFSRDANDLDEFLYDQDSGYSKQEAANQFNFIDFVFIEIDANLRPWSKHLKKVMVLIRMCLRTNKVLLATAGAMQALVFFVATNLETPVEVVNGPQGGPLGDMSKLSKSLDQMTKHEYFLDSITGDLYGIYFDKIESANCWIPIANCGIHSRRAVEEFNTVGKYMLQAPVYKPQKIKEIYGLYTSTQDEEICMIKKNFVQNYLFKDVMQEFLVHSKHAWDIHPFNVLNPKKTFVVLADSSKGPQVITVNENIVGLQFDINPKYPETQLILRNFIIHYLIQIRSCTNVPLSIQQANNDLRKNKLDLENMTKQQAESQQKGERTAFNFEVLTKFKHVGFTGKKAKKLEIVMNNAINDQGQLQEAMKTMRQKQSPRTKQSTEETDLEKSKFAKFSTKLNHEHRDTTEKFNKTAAEIRQMLHPNIDEQLLPENEPLWVPGTMNTSMLASTGQRIRQRPQSTTQSRTFKLTRVQTAKSRVSKGTTTKEDYDLCREHPIVRCSSPYITNVERDRLEQRQKDKQIIGPRSIRTSVVSTIKGGTPFILYDNPYSNPADFKHRDENKSKWVGGQNFRVC